ncbi:hypothetical protein JW868_02325 [Candidatus Woesearchaeota archaeon]|nr:hypothetical protein [Candidatus Woesearchaeota archaeon]
MGKISKDTPLSEITLRRYEPPSGMEKRDLVRKLCLSMGLLQPGDSRDVVVDVFMVLLEAGKEGKQLDSKEVEKLVVENRKKYSLELLGIAPSNIRRQLLRLRDLFFVEKKGNDYSIRENLQLKEIFDEHIEKYYLKSIVGRVRDYVGAVDREFKA